MIARNSSFTYKGKAIDIKQVGRELGVRYVLEGSVRKAGGRLRITGQLIEATSGSHLWAERSTVCSKKSSIYRIGSHKRSPPLLAQNCKKLKWHGFSECPQRIWMRTIVF